MVSQFTQFALGQTTEKRRRISPFTTMVVESLDFTEEDDSFPTLSKLRAQRAEIREAPEKEPVSIVGKAIKRFLPEKIAKPVLAFGEKTREFFVPSLSTQMTKALDEDTTRTTEQLKERARELDIEMGIMRNKEGEGFSIDPTGAFGTLKRGGTKEVIETVTESAAKKLLKTIGVSDDAAKRLPPKVVNAKTERE